jgi:hypothetical protein
MYLTLQIYKMVADCWKSIYCIKFLIFPQKETSKTFNYAVTKINRWEHILFTAGIYSQPVTDSLAQKLPIRIIEVMPD